MAAARLGRVSSRPGSRGLHELLGRAAYCRLAKVSVNCLRAYSIS
jgi:hypothetical protein